MAGFSRITVLITIVMIEASSQVTLTVPIVFSVMAAKYVADGIPNIDDRLVTGYSILQRKSPCFGLRWSSHRARHERVAGESDGGSKAERPRRSSGGNRYSNANQSPHDPLGLQLSEGVLTDRFNRIQGVVIRNSFIDFIERRRHSKK